MIRRLVAAATLALLAALVPTGTAHAVDDVVYIVNHGNNRCLDAAAEWNGANGTPVQLWDCYPPTQYNQMWRIHWLTDYDFQLVNVASGRCLDAKDWGTADGTRLQLWDCYELGNTNQIWHAQYTNTPNVRWLQEQHSFKVADGYAPMMGQNGAPVQLWYRIGEAQTNQLWTYKHASDF